MEELGYALRLARERRGLTQTQVMNLTGINNKTLSGYENHIAEPDLQTLTTLLRLYRLFPGSRAPPGAKAPGGALYYLASSQIAAAIIWAFFSRVSASIYSSGWCSVISCPGNRGPKATRLGHALA